MVLVIYLFMDAQYQAGTNCGKLASGLRGPTEFLRTKRSARVFSVGLRLSSFFGPRSSILGPETKENSRSREFSRDLASFFLARP